MSEVFTGEVLDKLGDLARVFGSGRVGVIRIRQVSPAEVEVMPTPYLRTRQVKDYFGGMSAAAWRTFRRKCPPSKKNPVRWHVGDLIEYRERHETVKGRF